MNAYESRPAGAASEADGPTPMVSERPESAAFQHFRNCYAVLVRGKRVRRHLYFNLPAAERTVTRAQLRGDDPEMILVRLVPVDSRQLEAVTDSE